MQQIKVNIAEQKVRFVVTEKGARVLSIFKEYADLKAGQEVTMFVREMFYYFGVAFHSYKEELFVNNEITILDESEQKYTFFFKGGQTAVNSGQNETEAFRKAGYSNNSLSELSHFIEGENGDFGKQYVFENAKWILVDSKPRDADDLSEDAYDSIIREDAKQELVTKLSGNHFADDEFQRSAR